MSSRPCPGSPFRNVPAEKVGMFFFVFFILFLKKESAKMICPKCGEKYEDDMPRCLWCDAPNPDYAAAMELLETEKNRNALDFKNYVKKIRKNSVKN